MANDVVKLLYFVAILRTATGYCFGTTKYATTSTSYITNYYYSNYEDCTFYIRPSSFYTASSYFLEISWVSFNVKGNMPYCSNDYVEVFLTSSYRSIGKYCSNNMKATLPFTMYSRDGYAKIKFHSDSSVTGTGFKLSFRLRAKQSSYLGSLYSTSCSPSTTYSYSNTIYSQGWPRSYRSSYSSCTHKIFSGGTGLKTRVVFMDVDLYYSYPSFSCSQDYIELKGSNTYTSSSLFASYISGKLCSTTQMKKYETSYDYLFIDFKREKGTTSSSEKGFLAGYVTYSTATNSNVSYSSSTNIVGVAIGVVVGVVVLVLILVFVIYFCKKKNETRATAAPLTMANPTLAGTYPMQSTTPYIAQNQMVITSSAGQGQPYTYPSYPTNQQSYPTPYPQPAGNIGSSDAAPNIASSGNPGQYAPTVSQGYVAPASGASQSVPPSAVTPVQPQLTSYGAPDSTLFPNAPPPPYTQAAVSQ